MSGDRAIDYSCTSCALNSSGGTVHVAQGVGELSSVKSQLANVLDFVRHTISVTTKQSQIIQKQMSVAILQ